MPFHNRLQKVVQSAALLALAFGAPLFAQDAVHQGFFTTSDGVKLHYLEAGQGQSILFIPGWLMPADIWEKQIQDFSRDYHVIALDPRSQGDSDITPQGNDPLRRSKDISELLDYLHLDSVVLVGWSLGAFDALAYLRQFDTDKVYALVLVDSPLAAPSTPAPAKRTPFIEKFQIDRASADPDYVWSLFKSPLPAGLFKKLELAEARIPTDIALSVLDNTRPGNPWEPSLQTLRQIPILYAITPSYTLQAEYLQKVIPWARVEMFANCGHALFVDQAARFNTLLRAFLKKASIYPPGISLPKETMFYPSLSTRLSKLNPVSTAVPVVHLSVPTRTPGLNRTFVPRPVSPPLPTPTSIVIAHPLPAFTSTPLPVFTPVPTAPPALPTSTFTFLPSPTSTPFPKTAFYPRHARKKNREEAVPIRDGYFMTSDHVRLHYLEAGQGMPLVFIPGWLISAKIWMPQLEDLSADYRVIALDPRSQGLSDMTPQGDEPLRQARDIQELLDHLQLDSVVLVGWSHGGFHVLAYMNEFGTDRLYAVGLVDCSLGAAAAPVTTGRQGRFLEELKTDRPGALRGFIWSLFKKTPPPDFIKELTQDALRTPPDIALSLLNNVFPGDPWQPSIQTLREVPIFYAVTPKLSFQANYLSQVSPLAHVEMFENAGHALFVDDSTHFNTAMRNFLKQAAFYPPGLPTKPGPKPRAAQP